MENNGKRSEKYYLKVMQMGFESQQWTKLIPSKKSTRTEQ